MDDLCIYSLIRKAEDRCAYTRQYCNDESAILFTQHYFCTVNENILVLILITPFLSFFLFHFLIKTAERYLSPAMVFVATYLELSETLAGITLIAFANGAPDFLASVVAQSDEQGTLIAIGSIFGAGLIMTTLIFGLIMYFGGFIKLQRGSFMRDLIFNVIGLTIIVGFGVLGYINYIMAASFVGLYGIYICVVMYNERQQAQDKSVQTMSKPKSEHSKAAASKKQEEDDHLLEQEIKSQPVAEELEPQGSTVWYEHLYENYCKVVYFVQKMTIFAQGEEQYNKKLGALHFLLCPLVMVLILREWDAELFGYDIWLVFLLVGALMAIYQLIFEWPLIFHVMLSIACALIWCKVMIEVLIDYLLLVQTLTEVSYSYLGMTFLAFGNSSCDLLVNMRLAIMGYGLMAITGCFAGAVFNIFAGFGCGLIRQTWFLQTRGKIGFNLFRDQEGLEGKALIVHRMNSSIATLLLLFTAMNYTMTYLIVKRTKFKVTRNMGFYYFFYYLIFFLTISTLTIALGQTISYMYPSSD